VERLRSLRVKRKAAATPRMGNGPGTVCWRSKLSEKVSSRPAVMVMVL